MSAESGGENRSEEENEGTPKQNINNQLGTPIGHSLRVVFRKRLIELINEAPCDQ